MKLSTSTMLAVCMCCLAACGQGSAGIQSHTQAPAGRTCEDWLGDSKNGPSDLEMLSLMLGAQAAYKADHPGPGPEPDGLTIKTYIEKFCNTPT